jgi:hypothetical protein
MYIEATPSLALRRCQRLVSAAVCQLDSSRDTMSWYRTSIPHIWDTGSEWLAMCTYDDRCGNDRIAEQVKKELS